MAVQIGLVPFSDLQPISFDDLVLRHIGCEPALIHKKRDQISSDYTLTCSCGLNIVVPRFGAFMTNMLDAAIDAQARSIGAGSISSDAAMAVDIVPQPF